MSAVSFVTLLEGMIRPDTQEKNARKIGYVAFAVRPTIDKAGHAARQQTGMQ